jgi:hypothetical protein
MNAKVREMVTAAEVFLATEVFITDAWIHPAGERDSYLVGGEL